MYDDIDFSILGELREDSKIGHKGLAEKLKIHQNTVIKRIKKLEEDGVILSYGVEINYGKLGFDTPAMVMMRLKKAGVGDKILLKNEIENAHVTSLFGITGINDCVGFVRAKDRSDLINILHEISKNKRIIKTNTDMIMSAHKYPYSFNPFKKVQIIQRDIGKAKGRYDHLDLLILKELRNYSKQSSRKLAEKLSIHHNTIMQRIKRLEKDNIIIKYRAWINFRKLGYNVHALVTIKLRKGEFGGAEFIDSVLDISEVEAFYSTTGLYDCCILIRAKNDENMVNVLRKLGDIKMISKTTTSVILAEYKRHNEYNPLAYIE